jgi:hypothetical protein
MSVVAGNFFSWKTYKILRVYQSWRRRQCDSMKYTNPYSLGDLLKTKLCH